MCYFLIFLLCIANIWLVLFINKKIKFYDAILEQAKLYYNQYLKKGVIKND